MSANTERLNALIEVIPVNPPGIVIDEIIALLAEKGIEVSRRTLFRDLKSIEFFLVVDSGGRRKARYYFKNKPDFNDFMPVKEKGMFSLGATDAQKVVDDWVNKIDSLPMSITDSKILRSIPEYIQSVAKDNDAMMSALSRMSGLIRFLPSSCLEGYRFGHDDNFHEVLNMVLRGEPGHLMFRYPEVSRTPFKVYGRPLGLVFIRPSVLVIMNIPYYKDSDKEVDLSEDLVDEKDIYYKVSRVPVDRILKAKKTNGEKDYCANFNSIVSSIFNPEVVPESMIDSESTVVLEVSEEGLKSFLHNPISPKQSIISHNERRIVRARIEINKVFIDRLLSLQNHVTVLEPFQLREYMHAALARMIKPYSTYKEVSTDSIVGVARMESEQDPLRKDYQIARQAAEMLMSNISKSKVPTK